APSRSAVPEHCRAMSNSSDYASALGRCLRFAGKFDARICAQSDAPAAECPHFAPGAAAPSREIRSNDKRGRPGTQRAQPFAAAYGAWPQLVENSCESFSLFRAAQIAAPAAPGAVLA